MSQYPRPSGVDQHTYYVNVGLELNSDSCSAVWGINNKSRSCGLR